VSCSGAGDCSGGASVGALEYYINSGVVNEACFPYTATDQSCSNKCSAPTNKIKIGGTMGVWEAEGEDNLKRKIIEKGAISAAVWTMAHNMNLVGYDTDPQDGKTIWIFKQSYGPDWGENGF
jgi:C1A family cysteine protease